MKSIFINIFEKLSWAFMIWTVMSLSPIINTRNRTNELLDSLISRSYIYIKDPASYSEVGQIVMSSRDHIKSIIKFIGI